MNMATEEQLTLPNVAGDDGKKIKINAEENGHCRLNKSSKSTRDASYLFLVHIGSGTTDLSCFWSTLPVLDFDICAMVACRVLCNDNRIGSAYSWGLLAPHVEIYYLARIS
jgi:hypothetical protein